MGFATIDMIICNPSLQKQKQKNGSGNEKKKEKERKEKKRKESLLIPFVQKRNFINHIGSRPMGVALMTRVHVRSDKQTNKQTNRNNLKNSIVVE